MGMSSRVLHRAELPPVDARLVAPESGYEIIEGRVIKVAPAREPHGSRHAKVGALLEACAHEDYDVALDMLTRVSETSDIAPDAAVFRRARDPETGGRYVEELAFEVLSTQTLADCSGRARMLVGRGVRRVFAVDVSHERMFEWSEAADDWQILPGDATIEDPVLAAPLPIDSLVAATKADDAMARALLAKANPVLTAAIADGQLAALRRAVLSVLAARNLGPSAAQRAAIESEGSLERLEQWLARASTANAVEDVTG